MASRSNPLAAAYKLLLGLSFLHNGMRLVANPQGLLTLWLRERGVVLGGDGQANTLVHRLKKRGMITRVALVSGEAALIKRKHGVQGGGLIWRIFEPDEFEVNQIVLPDERKRSSGASKQKSGSTEELAMVLEIARSTLEMSKQGAVTKRVISHLNSAISILSGTEGSLSPESRVTLQGVEEGLKRAISRSRAKAVRVIVSHALAIVAEALGQRVNKAQLDAVWERYRDAFVDPHELAQHTMELRRQQSSEGEEDPDPYITQSDEVTGPKPLLG